MNKVSKILIALAAVICCQFAIQAQITTGSISGTVTDASGAVVPGATVSVRGEAGQQYTATTNENGYYNIPGVAAGTPTYTVRISAPNFKTAVIQNVKVDVATPATANAVLEAGSIEETVVVTSGSEVLQTETATVGSTLTGRQILETPIQSRDALDLVTLLPGTNTVGTARTSSINGLPKSAITIQIDGVDVQDNFLKSSDGFFTFIRPRLDAIDEVTVSTSNPGAESSGDGAVGIRFATRRGTDNYRGSLFWQHRHEGFNANNFQNNYFGLPRQKLRLNQFGGSAGGPIPFLNFGEGVDAYDSGRGNRYFFVNYERYHLNEASPTRARTVLTSDAANGIFRFGPGGAQSVNLFQLAQAGGLPNTIDPTVAGLISTINAATQTAGTFQPLGTGGNFNARTYNISTPAEQRRRFLVVRTDFNLTKDHALEVIYNDQPFRGNFDTLNGLEPAFPGLTNAGVQNSDRRSLSVGLRSSFGSNLVNQFRYAQLAGWLGGSTRFDLVGGPEFFNQMRGFSITPGAFSSIVARNAFSARSSPTRDFTNNLTWVKGNHTMTFGGQLKRIMTISDSVGLVAPTVAFGVVGTDTAVLNAISATTLPGATAADVAAAQQLYATLTGRVSSFGANAVLSPAGQYEVNGPRHFEIQQDTNGLYAQDQWRIRPNFTLNYGVRWQPVTGAKLLTANYAIIEDFNQIYDVSGAGNLFSPGTLSGTAPRVRGNRIGEKAHRDDLNNFAPSVGIVWSPEGFMRRVFGTGGTSVIRAGYSRAYIREGTLTVENSLGLNPGGSFSLARNTGLGNLAVGTLFRDPANPNLTPPAFSPTPTFPRAVTAADAVFAFSPDFKTGYVDSFSAGYQRQLGRDTVVEVRYVGNRGRDMQLQYNLNQTNTIENGFAREFAIAQQNLLANIAAGRGANFRFFGAGTGTSPLPIIASFLGPVGGDPNAAATYTGANFASTGLVNALSVANPSVIGFAGTLAGTAAFRTTGAANGRPANFFNNCPTTVGFCFIFDNSEKSWYDAGVVEFRRRLANGFRMQASYTYGRAFTNAYASAGTPFFGIGAGDQSNAGNVQLRNRNLDKTPAQIDIRHAFKMDATIDLPFGKGQRWMNSSNWASNALFGGFSITPVIRWQSGSPISMEGVTLVGMNLKELQDAIGVYYNTTITQPTGATSVANVTWLPQDIIENTIRAFTTTGSTASGYTLVNGVPAAPTGRFIAPAGFGNCQQRFAGECGYRRLVIYGPSFFKFDATVIKRIPLGERRNIELRATAFDVLNRTNWRLGGWTSNVSQFTGFTGTFGQMGTGWSYQDPFGSNDPGGRLIDLMLRINW